MFYVLKVYGPEVYHYGPFLNYEAARRHADAYCQDYRYEIIPVSRVN